MHSQKEVRLNVPVTSSTAYVVVMVLTVGLLLAMFALSWLLGIRHIYLVTGCTLGVLALVQFPQRYEVRDGKLRHRSGALILWSHKILDIEQVTPMRCFTFCVLLPVDGLCIYTKNKKRKLGPTDVEGFFALLQQLDPELTRYGNELRRRPALDHPLESPR